jgi:hypothetical protein
MRARVRRGAEAALPQQRLQLATLLVAEVDYPLSLVQHWRLRRRRIPSLPAGCHNVNLSVVAQ